MADPQFEGFMVSEEQGIIHDTNTAGEGSKRDPFCPDTAPTGLAGNQYVRREIVHYTEHLPYSPATGFPEQAVQFVAGHRWTETEGKIHDGVGHNNNPF